MLLVDSNWLCVVQKESLVIVYIRLFYFKKKPLLVATVMNYRKKYLTITNVHKIFFKSHYRPSGLWGFW